DERPIANAAEAMDLPGLDDKDVTGARLEFLPVDQPQSSTVPDELDFIIRMPVRPWPSPVEGAEKVGGNIHVAVLGSHELVRAALKWEVLLTNTVHRLCS
ncbi:MAG TPA: hypothetical protein VFU40_11625, partial [Gemmatimonadales bacterium]|nr:hypothetical protein [Gemmatimonadales bacterium]